MGDGSIVRGRKIRYRYKTVGMFDVFCTANDGNGHTVRSESLKIVSGVLPTVEIQTPINGTFFRGGNLIFFKASATHPTENIASYQWSIKLKHEDHYHAIGYPVNGPHGTFTIPISGHPFTGRTA
jgi:hypothetical protein